VAAKIGLASAATTVLVAAKIGLASAATIALAVDKIGLASAATIAQVAAKIGLASAATIALAVDKIGLASAATTVLVAAKIGRASAAKIAETRVATSGRGSATIADVRRVRETSDRASAALARERRRASAASAIAGGAVASVPARAASAIAAAPRRRASSLASRSRAARGSARASHSLKKPRASTTARRALRVHARTTTTTTSSERAMGLYDVHAHLTHPKLAPHVDEILQRARSAGVTTIISNGLNPSDNRAVRELARRDPLVKPAFGLYPVDAVLPEMRALGIDYPREADDEPTADVAIGWVRDHLDEAFAVGEIGLDGYWVPEALWEQQEQSFRKLVALALEADKPIIIHTRKRERRALEILVEMGARRVDWHCFGGKLKLARAIAEQGHWLSIPANARRSESFTRMLETLPRDKLLLETDCPYLGPDRERDNEPENVRHTLSYAAELWKVGESQALTQLSENFAALFGSAP